MRFRSLASFEAWRGVEAQHVVATMRLADSLPEQAQVDVTRMQTWHRRVTREGAFMIHSASGRSIAVTFADGP